MSEIESAPVVTESAPASTADVASNVIDAFESSNTDSGIEVSGDTPDPAPADPVSDPVATVTPEPAELSEEERLLQEFGFKQAKKPDGRDHYIPRPKVLQMIASGLKRGQERWTSEKTTIESQVQEMRGHLEQLRAGIAGDEVAFLSEVAKIDPRYQRFIEPAKAAPQPQAINLDDMPDGDLPLPDGSRTFSLQGVKDLLVPWLVKNVEAGLMPKVDERLKPLTDREKQAQERERHAAIQEQLMTSAKSQMEAVQAKPLFGKIAADGKLTEFQQKVYDTWKANPSFDLMRAYHEVAEARLTEDDNTKRQRILQEVKRAAPRSPALTPGITDAPKEQGPVSTQDIAARTLARLERGA